MFGSAFFKAVTKRFPISAKRVARRNHSLEQFILSHKDRPITVHHKGGTITALPSEQLLG
jgi:hypothetical protein